jgi:hypothetical protein
MYWKMNPEWFADFRATESKSGSCQIQYFQKAASRIFPLKLERMS